MKTTLQMKHEEFVDWAAGHILTELIKGNFRSAVWLVIDQALRRDTEVA